MGKVRGRKQLKPAPPLTKQDSDYSVCYAPANTLRKRSVNASCDSCLSFDDFDDRISSQLMPEAFETEYDDHSSLVGDIVPDKPKGSSRKPLKKGKEKSKPKNKAPVSPKKQYAQYKTKEYLAQFGDGAVFI